MRLKKPTQHLRQELFGKGVFPVRAYAQRGQAIKPVGIGYHSELEIHLNRGGRFGYFVHDTNYLCRKNSVLIVHENETHNLTPDTDSSAIKIALIFSPDVIQNRAGSRDALCKLASVHQLVLTEKDAARAELVLVSIIDELRCRESYWEQMVSNHLETLLVILSRSAEKSPSDLERKDPVIQEAIRYIEAHFAEKNSLGVLAAQLNMATCTLSRKFKRYAGMGFREYLINRRIIEAKKLLLETDMKVITVAYTVGFDNLSTFNRDFRMLTDMTPARFRRASAMKS